jgi:ABC-type transport system involved in cytochrome bd biosynthesis fused ATPase/permease subunit
VFKHVAIVTTSAFLLFSILNYELHRMILQAQKYIYYCQKKWDEQTTQWPKGQTDNTMAKRTNRDQHISEARHSYPKLTLLYLIIIIGLYSKYLKILPNTVRVILLSVRPSSFGHCVVCLSFFFWPLCCLFVLLLLAIVLSVCPSSGQKKKDKQTTQWLKEEGQTDNTMAKRRRTNRQHNGQKKKDEQTTQWPKEEGQTRDYDYCFDIFKLFLFQQATI